MPRINTCKMERYQYGSRSLPPLELDKKRFRVKHCPCGKNNKDGKFVPYVGFDDKGYCHACGENFLPGLPQKDFQLAPIVQKRRRSQPVPKPPSCVPVSLFKASLAGHEGNHLVTFLTGLFGTEIALKVVSEYFIGTSKHWNGATVFWQVDLAGKIRGGKIMLYNAVTGKRIKEPFNHITWVHRVADLPEYELRQCFFGEHWLRDKTKPVAIVESEKTAIIASIYFPQFIWLAVGGLGNLKAERCGVLTGRTVILFPDLNKYEQWKERAQELSRIATFTVSDLLERKATEEERSKGLDLADYLVRFDYRDFAIQEAEQPPALPALVKVEAFEPVQVFEPAINWGAVRRELPIRESWDADILELANYFEGIPVPASPVKVNHWETVVNGALLIDSHLATVRTNNGNRTFLPYLNRLRELQRSLNRGFIF